MEKMQYVSILFEVAIAMMGIMLGGFKDKAYGWGIAFTYIIYVIYDTAKVLDMTMPDFLPVVFFLATMSMLWAVWRLILDLPNPKHAPEPVTPHHIADDVQKAEEI
ncbi:MAG: hypothetical protein PHW69_06880 [Elusimicrobiaceae bacterium]|nr:hypothetical protein [Elusimicrobiaceae bacterium]